MPNLPYDIHDPEGQSKLKRKFEDWKQEALAEHTKKIPEWDDIDRRMTGNYAPAGFTDDAIGDLVKQSDPTISPEEKEDSRLYVTVNRTRPNHESKLGDFIFQRRRLQISGRNPADRNKAKVYKSRIEYIEDSEQIPEGVYFPAFDNSFSKGLHWIKARFNPNKRDLRGRFEVSQVSCRDVLVDPSSRAYFFEDTQYRILRKRFLVEEAKKRFRKFPNFNAEALGPDTEYEDGYGRSDTSSKDRYATFYEVHFREYMQTYLRLNDNNELEEIDEERYEELLNNPETEDTVFEGDEEERYFIAIYHTHQGVINLQENPVGMFTLIPLPNTHTDGELYPLGDVVMYKNLTDLLDVLITILVDHGKRMNYPIAETDDELHERWKKTIEQVLKRGGAAPGIKNIYYPQQLNQAITSLVPNILQWIQDTASRHKATMGEMPSRQVATETVQTLISKDRQAQGRKDVMIRWTLTQLAKVLVKMIKVYDHEEDFIKLRENRSDSADYIPINAEWSQQEYLAQLAIMYDIPYPKNPEEEENFAVALADARRDFERNNDVRENIEEGFVVGNREFTEEEMLDMVEESGLPDKEFVALYQPQEKKIRIYQINMIDEDVDLNILYDIDDDYKNDPEFKSNRAILLNSRGAMSRLDMLREMDVTNPEDVIESADKENQAMQLAKEIAGNREAMEMVQQVLQEINQPQGQQ